MSTTTIRIDDELKKRIVRAATSTGQTSHAFILAAIELTLNETERNQGFHAAAESRWRALLEDGKSVPWDKARSYLTARSEGIETTKPRSRKSQR